MDEKKKAPKLRFKGFTDDWEQRKWKEIMLVNSGRDYKHLNEGKIPVYGTGGYMLSVDKSLSNIDAIGIGRKGTIDKPQYLSAPFWTVDTLFFMTPLKETNLKFLYALSQNINWKKYDESTGLPSLSKTTINNIVVKLPHNNEQNKIGKLISQIDNLLILQQRKLKQLILFKKGILQRIFKSSSVTQDILRLKEDSIQWKKERLRNIAKFLNGRAFKQKELLAKGKYPVVRVGNFYTNDKWYYSNLLLEDNKYLDKGDLLYTWSATFGPHIWTGTKAIFHYHIWKIDFDTKQIDKMFLYYFLEADKTQLLANTNGSTMIHITKSNMENKVIYLPPESIQTELGQMLNKLDNQIQRHNFKIKLLTELKQFLLKNMFI